MSLYALADHMASKGRNGDSMLVHMAPSEVAGLHALALAHGEKVTINPETGLPEMFSLKSILKAVLPAVAGFALGPAGFGLMSSLGAAATVGGATALATGSLSRGLMAGLGAYGGASLGSGLAGTGAGAEGAAGALGVEGASAAAGSQAAMLADQMSGFGAEGLQHLAGGASYAAGASPSMSAALSAGTRSLGTEAGRKAFLQNMGGGTKALSAAYMAASPMLADQGVQTTTKMPESQGYLRPYVFDPYTQGLKALTPVSHKDAYGPPTGGKAGGLMRLANGGAVAFADGGDTSALFREIYGRDPADWELENVKGMSTEQVRNILTESAKNIAPPPAPAQPSTAPIVSSAAAPTQLSNRTLDMPSIGVLNFLGMTPEEYIQQQEAAKNRAPDPYGFVTGGAQTGGAESTATRTSAPAGIPSSVLAPITPPPAPTAQTQKAPAGIPSSVLAPITPPPAPTAQTQQAPAAGLDAIYNALADQIYGRKKEAWNTAQRSLEDWELAQLQGASPEEARYILQYSIDNWRKLHPEVIKTPEAEIDKGGVGTYTPPPNPVVTPPPPPPPPYVPPDPFDWQKTPITRLPEFGPIKPEDVMSGRSLEAYNALMGKGSTATKQWDQAPMRPYLPQTGNQFFIQRGDTVVDTKNPTTTTTTTTPDPTTFTDPNQRPTAPPGPGMEWFWDSINKMWLQRPADTGVGNGGAGDSGGFGGDSGGAGGGGMGNSGEGGGGPGEGGWARGGYVPSYALGGLGSLGGYSDGGRLLKGPGDGVSDSIPATIGDRRPARLADGEFVVPARIVSELGNGSTDAGARKLYAMMDRVQRARGKTTGKGRVAANTRADKYLPA